MFTLTQVVAMSFLGVCVLDLTVLIQLASLDRIQGTEEKKKRKRGVIASRKKRVTAAAINFL